MSNLLVRFDPEADALYVAFGERRAVARTVELGDGRQVDYDADGGLLGVEFLNVSDGLNLNGVPHQDEVAAALRAFPTLSVA